jgi:hypothetical protein
MFDTYRSRPVTCCSSSSPAALGRAQSSSDGRRTDRASDIAEVDMDFDDLIVERPPTAGAPPDRPDRHI